MKSTTLVCGALVASLGFGTIAQAQPEHRGHERGDGAYAQQQQQWRDHAQQHWAGRGQGQPHWQQRQWQEPAQRWQAPAYPQRQSAPQYNRDWRADDNDTPRSYAYGGYYGAPHARAYYGPGYYAGGYAPAYAARRYWINDWRERHLYAPPYGYEWVQTDTGDVLLIALATGLIANAILAGQ